ncbi:MAG: hypothetical protein ABI039_14110 [Vicinamibacterales bacterium]
MSADLSRLVAALSNRYHVERELGQGGMATVFLAEDLKHKRKVALTVLKPELAAMVGADSQGVVHRDIKPENILSAAAPTAIWT